MAPGACRTISSINWRRFKVRRGNSSDRHQGFAEGQEGGTQGSAQEGWADCKAR